MKPYYSENGITIYHGDCRDVLPSLGRFDLLLTDPPYGIDAGNMNLGKWRSSRIECNDWDQFTPSPILLAECIAKASEAIIWGGNYFELPPSRAYFVWDKGEGFKGRDFAECEMAWVSWDAVARIYKRDPLANGDYRGKVHKTQKPLALIQWCIGQASFGDTILDPFMGSGTTLLAARLEGRQATGIEINERYCEAAAKRLSQGVFEFA